MVFVKVRETYDLHTIRNKMTVIGIHTPGAQIIKDNYPGLLLQCKAYRPVSCDVKLACASVLPLDPQGVGLTEGDVAPEDIFNPILYKVLSNFGMSNLDKLCISGALNTVGGTDSIDVDNDLTFKENNAGDPIDQFDMYYGLLSQTHEWKHANPQSGLIMRNLRPLVYETYQTYGDNTPGVGTASGGVPPRIQEIAEDGTALVVPVNTYRGKSHPMPMLNCTATISENVDGTEYPVGANPAFGGTALNYQCSVPAPKVFCGCIIVPPSRLHQLFYRLVCEWTLEFSMIRPYGDLVSWAGLANIGEHSHYMSYDFSAKIAPDFTSMVDTSEDSDIHKVM